MANRYIPFGYEIVDAQVVIIEREAEVVRNVFSLYVQGNSLKTISERLIYAETFENICIYNERESHTKDSTEIVLSFVVFLRLIEPCRAYAINIVPFARQKFCEKYFKENLLKIA